VTGKSASRPVYSTASGRLCARCGWPQASCRCSSQLEQNVPETLVAKLRIEKAGRGGKTVTVVYDLPRNAAFLAALAAELKRACGSGGTAAETSVEIQGEHRDRIRPLLAAKGWTVKG
jgi:translation initiation factor 1